MVGRAAAAITDEDVRALAAKLKGLHALLTPGEQVLLHTVLRRAAREPAAMDVEAVGWAVSFNPFAYLVGSAGGSRRVASQEGGCDEIPTD